MSIPNPSCAVALSRERNNATNSRSATGDATSIDSNARKPASLMELRTQLRAQLVRNHSEEPETAKQPELRTATVKPRCVVALPVGRDRATDAAEGRRQRVIAMLAENPNILRAVVLDNANTDPVLVTVALRNVATFELAIPAARFDPFKLLALIERHGATVH